MSSKTEVESHTGKLSLALSHLILKSLSSLSSRFDDCELFSKARFPLGRGISSGSGLLDASCYSNLRRQPCVAFRASLTVLVRAPAITARACVLSGLNGPCRYAVASKMTLLANSGMRPRAVAILRYPDATRCKHTILQEKKG